MPNDIKVKDMSARANKGVKNRDDFVICTRSIPDCRLRDTVKQNDVVRDRFTM